MYTHQETRQEIYKDIAADLLKNDLIDLGAYDPESAEGVTMEILNKHLGEYIIIEGHEIQ
jgi:hypothetical protein